MKNYEMYGVKWKEVDGELQQVCISCGEVNPKCLSLYEMKNKDYIKHIGRCECCGRYISVIERTDEGDSEEQLSSVD